MPSHSLVLKGSLNFTSAQSILQTWTSISLITSITHQMDNRFLCDIKLYHSSKKLNPILKRVLHQSNACVEHSVLFSIAWSEHITSIHLPSTVALIELKPPVPSSHSIHCAWSFRKITHSNVLRTNQRVHSIHEPTHCILSQTTNVLTTTTLIYTIRAGITAGAGTRLFL